MRKACYVALALAFSVNLSAQEKCGQHTIEEQIRQNNPALDSSFEAFDAQLEAMSQKSSRAEKFIIPVVFHVLHLNGPENISDAQIHDAMRIINEDFSALNPEISEVAQAFVDRIGTADIEFRLARIDPFGNETNGIDRIQTGETNVGDDGSKLNNWPRNMYLNIWTAEVVGVPNAAAYAYRPPAVNGSQGASVDGIMCNHEYVGSIGTARPNGIHTLSHEIGHYLGLPHPWGSTNEPELPSNCGIDDGISDTPNTIGTSGSCNLSQSTCGSLDNVQNFMDYATCESMFTEGQVNVMRNVLQSGVAQRNQLSQISNLEATGVVDLYSADFTASKQTICLGEEVTIYDRSQYDPTQWDWVLSGAETINSGDENPIFNLWPGVYDVALTVQKDGGSKAIVKDNYLVVPPLHGVALPFSEDFEDYVPSESGWAINDPLSNGFRWEVYEGNGTLGSRSFVMNNLNNGINITDDLIFGAIDGRMVSNFNINFKVAYSQTSGSSNDELALLISNDCGQTWRQVWSAFGSNLAAGTSNFQSSFTPQPSDWETFSVSNIPEAWIGANTFLKFTFTSGGGNNLYLDDINVSGDYRDVPQLVYPDDSAQNMFNNVTLDWRAVPGASEYEYQLDLTSEFNSSALISGTKAAIGDASNESDTEFGTSDLTRNQTYFWRVKTASSDWSETWSFTVAEEGLGVANQTIQNNRFVLYPNPSDELIRIKFLNPSDDYVTVLIRDLSGRQVSQPHAANTAQIQEISTSLLPAGYYVLEINENGSIQYEQFMVSH